MSTVVFQAFMTLDGVIQAPGGVDEDRDGGFEHGGWAGGFDIGDVVGDWERRTEALILGRRTYEIWSSYWPLQDEADPGGMGELTRRYNRVPKFVASRTLTSLDWAGSHRIGSDLANEVRAIEVPDGGEVRIWGSSGLMRSLAALDLVDEYRLLIHPIVLGTGKRLFPEGFPASSFALAESRSFDSGVVLAIYRPLRGSL